MHTFNSMRSESPQSLGRSAADSLALRVNLLVAGKRVYEPAVRTDAWLRSAEVPGMRLEAVRRPPNPHGKFFDRTPQEVAAFRELQETRRRFAEAHIRAEA